MDRVVNPLVGMGLLLGGLVLAQRRNGHKAILRNLEGYQDEHGFHPIRGSEGYDPKKTGEGLREAKAKEPWQMKQREYAAISPLWVEGKGIARLPHKTLVERALSEGKPVPPEVLADYHLAKPA